jgi:hypothetical protein
MFRVSLTLPKGPISYWFVDFIANVLPRLLP